MHLFSLRDVMSMRISRTGQVTCTFQSSPQEDAMNVSVFSNAADWPAAWRHAACFLEPKTKSLVLWHGPRNLTFPRDARMAQAGMAKLSIGQGAGGLNSSQGTTDFRGDLHLLWVWKNTKDLRAALSAELQDQNVDAPK